MRDTNLLRNQASCYVETWEALDILHAEWRLCFCWYKTSLQACIPPPPPSLSGQIITNSEWENKNNISWIKPAMIFTSLQHDLQTKEWLFVFRTAINVASQPCHPHWTNWGWGWAARQHAIICYYLLSFWHLHQVNRGQTCPDNCLDSWNRLHAMECPY